MIKNNIALYRAMYNLTQSQLAEGVGISKNAISSIERNEYFVSLETAFKLSKFFKVPIRKLFTYVEK